MNVEITGLTLRSGRTTAVAGVDLRAGLRPMTRRGARTSCQPDREEYPGRE